MTTELSGRTVVVTRARRQAAGLVSALESRGADVLCVPIIEILDPDSWAALDAAVDRLAAGSYECLILTSANAVERLFARIAASGKGRRTLERVRVAAVGRATSGALAVHGVVPDVVPSRATAAALAEAMGPGTGRVLLPRVADAPVELLDRLREQGWTPEEVVAYVNRLADPRGPEGEQVRAGSFDAVTFTSGSIVRGFSMTIGSPGGLGLSPADDGRRKVVCIGPATQQAARDLGFRVDAVATEQSDKGMAHAVAGAFAGSPDAEPI